MFIATVSALVLVGVVWWAVAAIHNAAVGSLVLRAFDLHVRPAGRETGLIQVVGRKAGLISFILTLIKLQSQCILTVTSPAVEFVSESLFGRHRIMVPLKHIVSLRGGIVRPLGYIIASAILILIGFGLMMVSLLTPSDVAPGFVATSVILMFVAVVFVVLYFLKRVFYIAIRSEAGPELAVRFQPSILEGRSIDFVQALIALDALQALILEREVSPIKAARAEFAFPGFDQWSSMAPAVPPPVPAYSDSPVFVGPEPQEVVADSPPELPQQDREKEALKMLREAVATYNSGEREKGISLLEGVVRTYPGTKAAGAAQTHLSKLGRATQ